MNTSNRIIGIACAAVMCSIFACAQDVFTFVAGKKAHAAITGDFVTSVRLLDQAVIIFAMR